MRFLRGKLNNANILWKAFSIKIGATHWGCRPLDKASLLALHTTFLQEA